MGRSSRWVLGGLVFAVGTIAACATAERGVPTEVGTTDSELIGGEAGSPFNTGAIEIWTGSGLPTNQGCTAVMIGPNQVLTAAHCVVLLTPIEDPTTVTTTILSAYFPQSPIAFTNAAVATSASTYFQTYVRGIDLSPDFKEQCASGCPNDFSTALPNAPQDLAIITLRDTFPQSFGLASRVGSASVGDAVTEVGYGCTQGVDVYTPPPPTFKYAGATILDPAGNVPPPFSVPNPTAFAANYYITAGMTGGGSASLCPGDSGGPLFKGSLAPNTEVVGINAYYFFPPDSGVSSINVFTRLDSLNAQTFINDTTAEYPPPNPVGDRGSPINDNGADPVANVFPLSTVSLETPGSPGCTGVILTDQLILTAAHCQVGPTTIAHFYGIASGAGDLPVASINASSSDVAATQGVTCDPTDVANYPSNCFTTTGSSGTLHDADLAVLTLSQTIPTGYTPVVLGPRGFGWQDAGALPSWWEVAAGGPTSVNGTSPLMWGPVTPLTDTSGNGQTQGWFYISSLYGLSNDSGGPVFQAPGQDAGANDAGVFMNVTLLGIVGDIGTCPQGVVSCNHRNTVTSVTFPDNYDFLVSLGGSPVPAAASYGAGN